MGRPSRVVPQSALNIHFTNKLTYPPSVVLMF